MWKFEADNSIKLYQNPKFEFDDGVNILIGPNGTGKTHLLQCIEEEAYDDSEYININYANMRHGGGAAKERFLLNDDFRSLATMITSSEGQGMYAAFGKIFFPQIGITLMKEEKKPKEEIRHILVITLDSLDSGMDIQSMREIINVCNLMAVDIPKQYPFIEKVVIIISANAYEFVRGRVCLDVLTGKKIKFESYEEYAEHIVKTKEEVWKRNLKYEKEEKERYGR